MAEKRRILDVWLVENNVVYRDVPYTVATDWIQQGRLLGEDRVRAAGGPKWYRLDAAPAQPAGGTRTGRARRILLAAAAGRRRRRRGHDPYPLDLGPQRIRRRYHS